MLYKEWLNIWLENYIKPTSKQRTYLRYAELAQLHIVPRLGTCEMDELTVDALQKFVNRLLLCGNIKTHKGLSSNTVCSIINVLQNSLKSATYAGYSQNYVADKVKRPPKEEKEIACFTLEEQKVIERAVQNSPKKKLYGIVLCFYTGLRIGELLALTLFKISPERIDTRKPQQPSGHEFVAMIKYILQIIVYYVIIGAKKILIAKEKQPDIFILVTTVLLTWLAYFVSFIFAIVLIVVLVTVVIFAFAKMVKFSTDGMPSQSNSDVVYVSDGGYDVELRLSGASDGYDIYEDSAGNKYVSDDHGKTVRKMSWDDVVSDEEITTQK